MNAKNWTVCVLEPNRFEAQIIVELLRMAGAERISVFHDAQAAASALERYPADVVIASFEMTPADGAAWTRAFRRNHRLANRKAAIFLTSRAFSRGIAEQCRHAGANALIGKPVSGKSLVATITKVLAKPRQFIDNEGEGYVGPCRRAGIVTTASTKRRRTDAERAEAEAACDTPMAANG